MEAILNSNSERVNNELADLTEQKTHALNKFFETVETSPNGGKNSVLQDTGFYFHPSPLPITTAANYNGTLLSNLVNAGVQGANKITASALLP